MSKVRICCRAVGLLAIALSFVGAPPAEARASEPLGYLAMAKPDKKVSPKKKKGKKKRTLGSEVEKGVGDALGKESSKPAKPRQAPARSDQHGPNAQQPPRAPGSPKKASAPRPSQGRRTPAGGEPAASGEPKAVEPKPVATSRELDDEAWQKANAAACRTPTSPTSCARVQAYLDSVVGGELEGGNEVEARKILASSKPKLQALEKDETSWGRAGAEKCRATKSKEGCSGVDLYRQQHPAGIHAEEAASLLEASRSARQSAR